MGKRPGNSDEKWQEAKRRCRLSAAELQMAKELGLTPRALIKNIPSKDQPWKTPVRQWVRDLHAKRFGKAPRAGRPAPPPPATAFDSASWLDLDVPFEVTLEAIMGLPDPTDPSALPPPARKVKKARKPRAPAKPAPVGTDVALIVPACGSDRPLSVTYWDLWFSLVAAADHGGDLARLADALADDESPRDDRESVRRKRSHIRDWLRRLTAAGRTIDDIVAAAGEFASTELTRARRRVLEPADKHRYWSDAMQDDPHERRLAHALRGWWPSFPISPKRSADEIWSRFKTKGCYTEDQSFGVARRLDAFIDRANALLAAGHHAEALAMLRALLTVIIELMNLADDSCGVIGDSFQQAFRIYLAIDLEKAGIDPATFFSDLLSLLIWEDYGLTWRQTAGYFGRLPRDQVDWIIAFLRTQIGELGAEDLEYQQDEALTLLGQVVAEQRRFEMFEPLAREMGSRHWERIIRLADTAVASGDHALAARVFQAAIAPGLHEDLLQDKYQQLLAGKWNPDPRR